MNSPNYAVVTNGHHYAPEMKFKKKTYLGNEYLHLSMIIFSLR